MSQQIPDTSPEFRPPQHNGTIWIARIFVHATGISAIAVLLLFVMVSPSAASTVARQFIEVPELSNGLFMRALIHTGCAAAIWGLLFTAASTLNAYRDNNKKPNKFTSTRMKATAGTILVETLIVLPVLLMLIFGLSQFAMNNVAAILARYAAYSGARTVWIWQPEYQANRKQVSEQNVAERARIAVALAMTPIAPGGGTNNELAVSNELKDIRLAMYNHFKSPLDMTSFNTHLNAEAIQNGKSLANAMDMSALSTRAIRKLTHAYLATEVPNTGVSLENGRVGVKFTYWHHQAVPLVGKIFGVPKAPGGRDGYYFEMPIEYSFPQQKHHVNARLPAH